MRVLFLSPRKAWPPTSGARLRDYHFALALSERFDLSYIFFGSASDAAEFRPHLNASSVEALPAPRKYSATKVLRGLAGRTPLSVLNYEGPEMPLAIEASAAKAPYDLVHLESLHFASYIPAIRRFLPKALITLDWHNIESELMRRFAANTRSPLKRFYAILTARKLQHLETFLLSECFGHLVCSEREKNLLLSINPHARVELIENGVDSARFRPAPVQNPRQLLFVGQMSYHANVEATIWFVRRIWPAVHAHFPGLSLAIVGSEPGPAVLALARAGEIDVSGTVPDVLPFYQQAFASIVPLQTGGGTRLKILEAMAAGTPVISTACGAEGLEVTPGRTIQIAGDDAQTWIDALRNLENPQTRLRMIEDARDLVCRRYDWATIGARLADTYLKWLAERLKAF